MSINKNKSKNTTTKSVKLTDAAHDKPPASFEAWPQDRDLSVTAFWILFIRFASLSALKDNYPSVTLTRTGFFSNAVG